MEALGYGDEALLTLANDSTVPLSYVHLIDDSLDVQEKPPAAARTRECSGMEAGNEKCDISDLEQSSGEEFEFEDD